MKKKGFTLIELLAVILILGIIAVIAYPQVQGIIEKTKKSAFKTTAEVITKAAEYSWNNNNAAEEYYYIDGKKYTTSDKNLKINGDIPEFGIINITESGNVAAALYNGVYCATIAGDEEIVTVAKETISNCTTYNIIKTSDTWSEIATKYNVVVENLLDLNNENDINSTTIGRNIKIPVAIVLNSDELVLEGAGLIYKNRLISYTYQAATTKLNVDDNDDGTLAIDLGFDFKFGGANGNTYSTIYPSTNGQISFVEDNAYEYTNEPINAWAAYPIIASYWTDLYFDFDLMPASGIYYTIGIENNKNYILIEWRDITDLNSDNQDVTTTGDFEIKLYEDGNIKVYYQDVEFEGVDYSNGIDATLGVFATATNYSQYSHLSDSILNGQAIEYYLAPGTIVDAGCFAFDGLTGTINDYSPYCTKDVVIPETINGIAVTKIGENAFYDNSLTSVTIPNGIVSIGKYAFEDNLITNLTLPNTLTTISEGAFSSNQLTGITIPSSVTYLSGFQSNQITSLTIPNTVTTIGDWAFANNQLTTITIPNGVVSVGNYSFNSNQLTSISIPSSVTYLSGFGQNQLTSVTIPNTVNTIGEAAFYGDQLVNINIPNSIQTIGMRAFAVNQLTNVTIPNNVTSMGREVFYSNKLTSVTLGTGITELPDQTFAHNLLVSITLPSNITTIGADSLSDNKFTSFTIPSNITAIKNSAFYFNQLVSINVPLTVTSLGDGVFSANTTLTSLTVDASNPNYKSIGNAIYTKDGTKIIMGTASASNNIQNTVTTIGSFAFAGMNLTSLTIPNGVITIENKAFAMNGGVNVGINIPNSVQIIGDYAFSNLPSMPSVAIGGGVKTIGTGAFFDCHLTSVTIPNNVTSIGSNAFYYNYIPQGSATIDNTVGNVTIGSGVFNNNGAARSTTITPVYLR